jgi:hypothetical protein
MGAWVPTKIRWVSETLTSSTGAARVETDQGPAYAKLLGNPEGPQALFCEWVGTRAASWLGLPTFDTAVVDVAEPGLVTYPDGSASHAGAAFVARLQDGTTWGGTGQELAAVENPGVFSGLVVLDTWLRNCDRFRPAHDEVRRNTRNVFLGADGASKGRFRLLAMDHTHCFTCGRAITRGIKNIDQVQDARLYGHFPEFRAHLKHEAVTAFAARLRGFAKETARSLLAGVPRAWQPAADVVAALEDFLTDRAAFVGQNVRRMLVDQGELQPELELGA